jgi:hypothetical protein
MSFLAFNTDAFVTIDPFNKKSIDLAIQRPKAEPIYTLLFQTINQQSSHYEA